MKKIFKYLALVFLCSAALGSCVKSELDTDQYGEGVRISGIAPNPVMRGGQLRILGSNLDQVTEVRFSGDVTVSEIEVVTPGAHGEIRVTVPVEGPETGPVVIVAKDGSQSRSLSDLTFTEPIEVTSIAPATVLSGDILTIKGEYLNVVREVIFSGEDAFVTAFESQSRHELKVKVPANAVSGPVILSDVNEVEDANTIPNHIYTNDLAVGNPTVTKAAKTVYKSGDVITVSGAHLDMIETVNLPQAADVDFTVAADAKSMTFNLPPKAGDGNIQLVSYAGVSFDAGEIETVNVAELSVESLAEDGRFKAGSDVSITGTDLDLVVKVEFQNAEASWYLDGKKIVATVPAGAQDGPVTVSLESGKKAYSEDIEVVKPVATSVSAADGVAGADVIEVFGEDLDLVTSAKIGSKEQGFIDCEFELKTGEDGAISVAVALPQQAYSGPIVLTADSGYETETEVITISYDEAVAIVFDKESYGLGENITITGKNLMLVEQIFIKGKKVTSFAVREDNAMAFGIPEGTSPGVYRLGLVLVDGTELTWPVPFVITAPFTETFVWEGNHDLAGWGANLEAGPEDGWVAAGLEEGDLVRIYYTTYDDGWQFKLQDGHWNAINLDILGGANTVNGNYAPSGTASFSFEATPEIVAQLTTMAGWGSSFVINGEGAIITGISRIHFGAAEKRDTIWEGSVAVDWGGNTPGAEGAMTALSWGGYDWASVAEGTILALAFDRTADEVQIRLGNGAWSALPGTEDPYKPEGNELKVELTAAMLNTLVNEGGLVVTGQGYTLKEIALVTAAPSVPTGTTIWEGSHTIDWSGGLGDDHKSLGALSWGGYDWASVAEGTTLVIEFDLVGDVEAQIRVSNGGWAALPGTEDPYKPAASPLEVELTADMLGVLVNEGGLVLTGQGVTLTAVILR